MVAGNGVPGFAFADWALTVPWGDNPLQLFYRTMPQHAALFVAGWINLVFLLAVGTKLLWGHKRGFKMLRIVLILMIPSCFLVSHYQGFYFREGFYAWVLGMMVVLFSDDLAYLQPKQATSPIEGSGPAIAQRPRGTSS